MDKRQIRIKRFKKGGIGREINMNRAERDSLHEKINLVLTNPMNENIVDAAGDFAKRATKDESLYILPVGLSSRDYFVG